VLNHRKGFFHSDSLSPYFYIVLLRELDTAVAKEMERDEKMIPGKGIVAFVLNILIVCLVGNLFLIENCPAVGATLYVGGSEPGNYTPIQKTINNATNGDTVSVSSGTYNENVYIDKSLNLIGNSKPVINGQDSHKSTIEIMSDNVTISGFEIHNTIGLSSSYSSIAVGKQENFRYVVINNCYITDAGYGIMIKGYHHTISNCIIKNIQEYGIMLVSGANNINVIDIYVQIGQGWIL